MTMTRKVTWDAPASKRPRTNAYEIAKIKRVLGERKPEMKSQAYGAATETKLTGTIKVQEITDIAAGDEAYARDGLQIKLHRIFYTVTAYANGTQNPVPGVDVFLITGKSDRVPVYADFIAQIGGTINKNEYTTWKQHVIGGDNHGIVQDAHHFQYPMKVYFSSNSSTSSLRNKTYLVVKNNTGVSVDVNISSRLWFSDN